MAKEKKVEAPQGPTMEQINYVPALQKKYKEEIIASLTKEFGYKTIMQVPKLVKIAINEGIGSATQDKKLVEVAQQELTSITGQKAVQTVSRKDISNFIIDNIDDYEECSFGTHYGAVLRKTYDKMNKEFVIYFEDSGCFVRCFADKSLP